jgi:hypothetical protein
MKAKRYMKPPSCRKPATVIVPYAGPALDGQRPTRTISEPRILSVNPGRKSWEGTKGTTSPCPHCWAHTPCHDERSHEGGLPARVAPDLLRLIARRMRRRLLMLNRVGCLFDYQLRPTTIQVRSPDTSRRRQAPFPDEPTSSPSSASTSGYFYVTFSKPLRTAVVGRRGWANRGDKRTWAVGRKRTVADRYEVGEMVVAPA